MATIHQLETELRDLLKSVSTFAGSGFSVFSADDFDAKVSGMGLPVAGVVYDGAVPTGNGVTSQGPQTQGVATVDVQFIIVVGIQYSYTGADDNKPQAYDLMDQVRAKVLGYKGVNTRPWRFVGERPEADASGDGVVFYSQVWQTTIVSVGNSQ